MPLKSLDDVPGPQGVAAQWRLYWSRYRYGEMLHEISRCHGDIARLPIPGCPTVLLSHPDQIHAVLAAKAHYFRIFGQDMLRRITPWGLVATEGQVHDENRSRMMLAMRKILSRRVPAEASCACHRCLASVEDGAVVDVGRLAREVTLQVAASILYPAADDDPAAPPRSCRVRQPALPVQRLAAAVSAGGPMGGVHGRSAEDDPDGEAPTQDPRAGS